MASIAFAIYSPFDDRFVYCKLVDTKFAQVKMDFYNFLWKKKLSNRTVIENHKFDHNRDVFLTICQSSKFHAFFSGNYKKKTRCWKELTRVLPVQDVVEHNRIIGKSLENNIEHIGQSSK